MRTTQSLLGAGVVFLAVLTTSFTTFAADDGRSKLIGTWQGVVVDGDAQKQGTVRFRIKELVITADKISAQDQTGRSMGEGTYKVDLAKRTIETTGLSGQYTGKTYLGIISLDGNKLVWCAGNPGRPRPTEFKTKAPDAFLMILTKK
jgi:uncharacterized protein (TIGR03067 family)